MAYCNVSPDCHALASVKAIRNTVVCRRYTLVARSRTGITNVMARKSHLMGGSFCYWCSRQELNLQLRFRRPMRYSLSPQEQTYGAPGGSPTPDPLVRSETLCALSYGCKTKMEILPGYDPRTEL